MTARILTKYLLILLKNWLLFWEIIIYGSVFKPWYLVWRMTDFIHRALHSYPAIIYIHVCFDGQKRKLDTLTNSCYPINRKKKVFICMKHSTHEFDKSNIFIDETNYCIRLYLGSRTYWHIIQYKEISVLCTILKINQKLLTNIIRSCYFLERRTQLRSERINRVIFPGKFWRRRSQLLNWAVT